MDEELAGWQQAIKLMEEAARIGKEDYVHLHSGSYSRKLLYFLYEQDAFRPTKYNGYDGYNDYLFLLDMFNGGFCSEAQERKCQAIIMQSIYPWLRNLWKKSKGVRHILPRRLLPSSGCYARMFRRLRPGLRWN